MVASAAPVIIFVAPGPMEDKCTQSVFYFGVSNSSMHHRLLISALIIAEIRIFLQSLSQTSYISMSENAETTAKIGLFNTISFNVLIFQKGYGSLCYCESSGHLNGRI